MTRTLLLATAALSLGLLSPASARSLSGPLAWQVPGIFQAQDDTLSEPELRDALEIAGYSEIRVLQAEGDMYDMSAQKDGRPVLLRVNARTRRYSERPGG